ncbi:MAG: glycosyltransferase family 39 protein [Candidatus Gastranaerophilales bacterium]|nr:glycosyltransferase family 39 protein [Candidatus Gastranaerophilales bacterium]
MDMLLDKYQIPVLLLEFGMILFLVIRICRNEAVDWDEAYTWMLATKNSIPEMLRATAADVHPPLYYLLVMAAMRIFGETIFVAKMVSVAGMAAICLLGVTIVRKRFGVKASTLFLLVAGLGTQVIFYNVNVRMYSWMMFFVLLAGLSAYEIILNEKSRWWVIFTLASLGGVYTQYFAVVPLMFLYLFLLGWFMLRARGGRSKTGLRVA